MNIYARADASSKIGTGHIMRCIALGQALQDQGDAVTFISHCESDILQERIQAEGFRLISLDKACPDPSDLIKTLSILKEESADEKYWLILDGYHFTSEYQKAIRDAGGQLLIIDDMNHLAHYHADIILNQNIHALDLNYHCDNNTTLLLGTRYALLRREFLACRNFSRQIADRAKNILITLGGADRDNVTVRVINALKHLGESDISVKIIIGPANPHRESLCRSLIGAPFAAEVFVNPNNIPELMAWADIAISASGSTCWELAFMGVPSIILVLAENQVSVAEYLMNNKSAISLGRISENIEEDITYACNCLISDNALRRHFFEQSKAILTEQGPSLVIESMRRRNLMLRDVTDIDSELIWHWANDGETRKASYSQARISWGEHTQWFDSLQRQSNHRFYIAINGSNKPVGQIRFAIDGKDATVSFSVAPESRKMDYGKEILIKGVEKLFNENSIQQILAYVKSENGASLRVFQKAGFRMVEEIIVCGVKSHRLILTRKDLS